MENKKMMVAIDEQVKKQLEAIKKEKELASLSAVVKLLLKKYSSEI